MAETNTSKFPIYAVIVTVVFKLLFLLTHYIQEDAFITWRVAQNLLDYGVIGFNGDTKISASTTHLYVFVSYLFNLVFGKEHFIEPLLIFNSILFTIGTLLLSHLVLKNPWHKAIFIFLIGILPPAIKISILGMEYGILFFLEMILLYYGFHKGKKWVLTLLPVLIMFTRIDTVIFLGIIFLVDVFWNRKIRWNYIFGGILGVLCTVAFNWFYFGELVNNTITAKKLLYEQSFTFQQNVNYFLVSFGNFWGMLKVPGNFNPVTIIVLIFELLCFIYLVRQRQNRNYFLWIIFMFGWAKQIVFISQKSLFDWYYWVPQLLLFVPVLIFVLEQKVKRNLWLSLLIVLYILPMMAFQTIHSIATGNGEWNYRRTIGLFLNTYEKDKNQWILLEPAGYVPYFSGLKTIDEVGLVDKQIQGEIKKDKKNYWINTVKNRKPKYLLSYKNLYEGTNAEALYYQSHYKLLKEFRVKDHLNSDNKILEKIYHLKPSGTDYNLYIRID
ncbi:hypothetical protein C1637_13920 [Chryseobacterium lactis]|uniref:Glycosyltransferase RgtA/B/C/D-like domain-containing protein n=1 Tax=Chryseobacterium lactis TaxID=1241981 RepID=A0A3G6RQL9_CHRLC|nr:hypothetical protein [Chryseobacterium lactis]AZA83781.1 hypothetical protein EG342_18645 [Chryseobacterium lactis]AZB04166.1 hypothetical protein EG341_09520 [Chryseobacterium lactis]PNW12925.1 hypothetical protein C1637_13920 [Chryseobacterium lactis]